MGVTVRWYCPRCFHSFYYAGAGQLVCRRCTWLGTRMNADRSFTDCGDYGLKVVPSC